MIQVAERANIARVTLNLIKSGQPSVTNEVIESDDFKRINNLQKTFPL